FRFVSVLFILGVPISLIYTLSLHDALPILVVRALQELDVHQRFFHGRRLRETEAGAFSIGRIRGPYLIVARTVRRTTEPRRASRDRKSTRLNSSHQIISYAVFCLKKKNKAK